MAGGQIFSLYGLISLKGVETVNKALEGIDSKMAMLSDNMNRGAAKMVAAGKQMTLGITAPVAALGAVVAKFSGDFDDSMTKSLAIMKGVNATTRKELTETAREVSRSSTITQDESAKAYFYLASAGKNAAQSMALLPKVAKFAEAGSFDMALATDLLTDAQSALGLTSKNTAEDMNNLVRVSDVLVKANTLANATVQQFSESLTNKAAASLRLVNKSVEEGVAVLAAYADQGVKGELAGQQLAIVLRDLQKAALNNSNEFKNYNISVYDSNGTMKNMADIIYDLETAFDDMSDAEKRATITKLGFQDRSVQSLLTLIGTSDKIREYNYELDRAGGITETVSEKNMQSFNAQMAILKNRLIDAAIGLGNSLLPIIKNQFMPMVDIAINKIQGLVKWFNSLNPAVKQLIVGITAFAAVAGPAIAVIGQIIVVFNSLKMAILAVNIAMTSTPFGLVLVGAFMLSAGIVALTQDYDRLATAHEGTVEVMTKEEAQVKTFTTAMKSLNEEIAKSASNFTSEEEALKEVGPQLGKVTEMARAMGKTIEGTNAERYKQLQLLNAELNNVLTVDEAASGMSKKAQAAAKSKAETTAKYTEAELAEIQAYNDKQQVMIDRQVKAVQNAERAKQKAINKKNLANLTQFEKQNKRYQEAVLKDQKEGMEAIEELDEWAHDENRKRLERKKEEQKQFYIDTYNQLGDVVSGFLNNRLVAADNAYKKEKQYIEDTITNEEEKEAALEKLDKKHNKEVLKIRKQQAIIDKAVALFNIGVNTATAITEVLGTPWMVPIVAALGAAQAAIVASAPIPLQKGGYTEGSRAGAMALFGENNTKEIVMPLDVGVNKLATMFIDKLGSMKLKGKGAGNVLTNNNNSNLVLNIGTFIGDDKGIKNLTRKIIPILNSEGKRKGVAAYV